MLYISKFKKEWKVDPDSFDEWDEKVVKCSKYGTNIGIPKF